MKTPSISTLQPVVLPPTYTTTTAPESFPDSSYGTLAWHTLFSHPHTPTRDLIAGLAVCPPNTGHLCAHRHAQAEIYYIVQGDGEVTIDGRRWTVTAGSTVYIPPNSEHEIANTGTADLRWFYVFPTSSFGDVVYRFSKDEKAKL
ncbi:Cupin 2 conserved barrel [Penicillium alfredii]|uniref:Cupin 2 conserved barrel n=1 Tax=Penicillium alfredii TaxID=1506179 RepID=A0A9W9EMA5_9EURO|nr:Cupin 2 conserved barrel [Penicillium alfredii]KAJ5084442.1 Cupin 2 conserved barrel [Penicillium alfredii]